MQYLPIFLIAVRGRFYTTVSSTIHIQLEHALNNGNHASHLDFCNRIFDMMTVLVLRESTENKLYGVKLTYWCSISSRAVLGPYFFEDENECTVTVNTLCYINMWENYL